MARCALLFFALIFGMLAMLFEKKRGSGDLWAVCAALALVAFILPD